MAPRVSRPENFAGMPRRYREQAGKTAVCPSAGCDAEYKLVGVEGNTPTVEALVVHFECPACKTAASLPQRKVALGFPDSNGLKRSPPRPTACTQGGGQAVMA